MKNRAINCVTLFRIPLFPPLLSRISNSNSSTKKTRERSRNSSLFVERERERGEGYLSIFNRKNMYLGNPRICWIFMHGIRNRIKSNLSNLQPWIFNGQTVSLPSPHSPIRQMKIDQSLPYFVVWILWISFFRACQS